MDERQAESGEGGLYEGELLQAMISCGFRGSR